MTIEHQLTCPVCRAKQIPQNNCRRCDADLSLYIKATDSLAFAQQQYSVISQTDNQPTKEKLLNYLRWLSSTQA